MWLVIYCWNCLWKSAHIKLKGQDLYRSNAVENSTRWPTCSSGNNNSYHNTNGSNKFGRKIQITEHPEDRTNILPSHLHSFSNNQSNNCWFYEKNNWNIMKKQLYYQTTYRILIWILLKRIFWAVLWTYYLNAFAWMKLIYITVLMQEP